MNFNCIAATQVHIPEPETDSPSVKIRFRLDDHRILNLEEITLEEKLPAPVTETDPKETNDEVKEDSSEIVEKMDCDDTAKDKVLIKGTTWFKLILLYKLPILSNSGTR